MTAEKNFFGIFTDREDSQGVNLPPRAENMTDYGLKEYREDLGLSEEDLIEIEGWGGKILDVGAGNLNFAEDCYDLLDGIKIYAEEPNLKKLDEKRVGEVADKIGFDHIIAHGTADMPTLKDGEFQLILIHHGALSYARNEFDTLKMMKELLRVLAVGGEIRISPVEEIPAGKVLHFQQPSLSAQSAMEKYFNFLLADLNKLNQEYDDFKIEAEFHDLENNPRTAGYVVIKKVKWGEEGREKKPALVIHPKFLERINEEKRRKFLERLMVEKTVGERKRSFDYKIFFRASELPADAEQYEPGSKFFLGRIRNRKTGEFDVYRYDGGEDPDFIL